MCDRMHFFLNSSQMNRVLICAESHVSRTMILEIRAFPLHVPSAKKTMYLTAEASSLVSMSFFHWENGISMSSGVHQIADLFGEKNVTAGDFDCSMLHGDSMIDCSHLSTRVNASASEIVLLMEIENVYESKIVDHGLLNSSLIQIKRAEMIARSFEFYKFEQLLRG